MNHNKVKSRRSERVCLDQKIKYNINNIEEMNLLARAGSERFGNSFSISFNNINIYINDYINKYKNQIVDILKNIYKEYGKFEFLYTFIVQKGDKITYLNSDRDEIDEIKHITTNIIQPGIHFGLNNVKTFYINFYVERNGRIFFEKNLNRLNSLIQKYRKSDVDRASLIKKLLDNICDEELQNLVNLKEHIKKAIAALTTKK